MTERWSVVRLKGGLGNQLFQFAFGMSSAHATGNRLVLDTSWFASQNLRGQELTSAFRGVPVADLRPLRLPGAVRVRSDGEGPSGWLARRDERSFRYDDELLAPSSRSIYFDGYFQSWRYLEGIRKQLDEALTLASPSAAFEEASAQRDLANAIAVHVRLGDYRTDAAANRVHGLLAPSYYEQALERCVEESGLSRVVLFSDEPEAAVARIPALRDAEHVDLPPTAHPMESVALLAQCGARVVANSSFSWWGAYLSDANPRLNFAPWPWFRSDRHDAIDLLPDTWTRIDADWTS